MNKKRVKHGIWTLIAFIAIQMMVIGLFRVLGLDGLDPWFLVIIGFLGTITMIVLHKHIPL